MKKVFFAVLTTLSLFSFQIVQAADKVIFGTDFPVLDFARTIKEIEELDINEVALKKLMYENTQKIYNL